MRRAVADPPEHERRDQQHDDDADDGAQDAAEVERVVVSDAECTCEDQIADECADQPEDDGEEPRLRAFDVFEGVVGDECSSDESGNETEDQCANPVDLLRR